MARTTLSDARAEGFALGLRALQALEQLRQIVQLNDPKLNDLIRDQLAQMFFDSEQGSRGSAEGNR